MHESTFYSVFVYLLEVKIMKISNIGAFNSGYYKLYPELSAPMLVILETIFIKENNAFSQETRQFV